jgi:hypothetical protein
MSRTDATDKYQLPVSAHPQRYPKHDLRTGDCDLPTNTKPTSPTPPIATGPSDPSGEPAPDTSTGPRNKRTRRRRTDGREQMVT